MKKPGEQNVTCSDAKSADQTQKTGRFIDAPTFTKSERITNPMPKAREATHQFTPRNAIKEPPMPISAQDAVIAPKQLLRVTTSARARMTRVMDLPSAAEINFKWKQQVGAAKITWGKLTENALQQLEGHKEKLAGLDQARYAITLDEVDKQVRSFFESNKS